MPLLASSWLLVESFVIPHGFLKWFCLSYYIHPVFLVFCQIFLWLNQLVNILIILLYYPLTFVFNSTLLVFGFIGRAVVYLFSYIRPTQSDVFYDALEPDVAAADCAVVVSCKNSTHLAMAFHAVSYNGVDDACDEVKEEINGNSSVQDSWLNDYLYSDHYTASVMIRDVSMSSESVVSMPLFRLSSVDQSSDHEEDQFVHGPSEDAHDPILLSTSPNDSVLPVSSSNLDVILDQGCNSPSAQQSNVVDQFEHKYTSRMKFFNILYYERLHGIEMISNELLSSSPSLFDCIGAIRRPEQHKKWSTEARKRLMRSLECDLEMICVAQCCLFWEALDNQFHIVKTQILSDDSGKMLLFQHDIFGRFQDFQIQLERFGQGSSRNNTSKRLSFQVLLQVPDVTGFGVMEEEKQMTMNTDYCITPTQLLQAIDNCIKAFWSYIKTDEKKPFWKYKGIWRTPPPVEHPQDLELLYDVEKNFHKKWIMLRGLQGKSKCWLRRKVKAVVAEDEKRNVVFGMIDLNLVQRLLKLPLLSNSHLQWCQHTLENLHFVQDRVVRTPTTHFFPFS